MKKFLVCRPAVLFILLSVFILSCEVGLGESVDTEAPKISITYPDAKSVIKDRFVLAGECSDDRMVTSVQVTILDSSNNPVTGYELKAPVVESAKSGQVWSVEINAKNADGSYPLKDGKYTFRTIATDGAGRKSAPFERDLEIDNTAPVFVINSPGSTDTETSYGSVLKVEGSIAEAHSVKSMALTVYDTNGIEKASWKEENINIAGGTSVTFAKYYSNTGGTDSLLTRYNEIYDTQAGGFQAFKCSVELTDSACVYQKPDFVPSYNRSSDAGQPVSSDGNTTCDVWLYDDIYGTDAKYVLMGTKASEVWGKAFEVSDFMNILNGTVPYDTPNADGKTVLEVLNSAKTDTSEKSLKMKLNKDANPTYTVMGYSFDSTAEKDGVLTLSPAAKGGTITFKADAGLDGVLFSPETIKVYLFGPFEKDAVSLKLSDIYNDPKAYAEKNAQVTSILYDGKNGVGGGSPDIYGPYTGESRSTWTQSLSLPSDSKIMKATKCYVIAATGEDKDNVEFISANNKYNGFEAQATGVPPSVTIKEPKTDFISNNPQDILTVKGTIKSDEGTAVNDASYEIYVYDVTNNNTLLGTIKNRDTNSDDNGSMKITGTLGVDSEVSFEIDASKGTWYPEKDASKDGTKPSEGNVFKYVISVSGVTDTTGKDSVTAQVDMLKPTVSVEVSTLLSIEKDGKTRDKCVNGEITVKTSLSDNDKIAQSWIEITGASLSEPKKIDDRSSGVTNYSVPFDTTTINDGEYTVTVYAKDNAGNIGSSSQQIYVDQSTDLPVITLSNADKTFTEKPSLSSNLFGMGSNVLIGAVSDDDGIASIDYIIDEDKGENAIRGTIDMAGKTPTSKSFQIDFAQLVKNGKLSSGTHTLSVSATDISNGLKVPTPIKSDDKTGVSKMTFGYDDDVPSLSVTAKSGGLAGSFISYTITGTASDGSAFTLYRYSIDPGRNKKDDGTALYGSKENPVEISVSADDGTWTDTIKTTDNGDEFEYCIIDEYERSTTAKFTFKIDSVKPVIEIETPSEDKVYIGETKLYSFRGTADDPTKIVNDKGEVITVDSSGISGIKYTVYASDGTKIETKTVDSSTQWNININLSDYKNANDEIDVSKIEFISVDGGGLESEPVSKNIIIDKESPSIKFTISGIEKNDTETLYICNEPVFYFEVSDENLNFDSVKCSVPLSWTLNEKTASSVKYTISGFASDSVASVSKNYSFTAEDKSGRITERSLNVFYDKDPPVIDDPSVTPIAKKESDATEYVNGIINVKGTVSDNDKVQSTEVILKQGGNTVSAEGCLVLVSNSNDRYEYKIDTTKLSDAPLEILIKSTDRAGNVNQKTKTVTVDQETDKPVLKFSNGDVNIKDESSIQVGTNLFGMGSNTLYINVSDDDGIKSVSLTVDGGTPDKLLTDGKSTTWSTSKDVSKYGPGVHSLKFTITDTEGKTVSYPEGESDTIKIAFDDDVPLISDIKIGGKTYEANMFVPKDFTITGKATDESTIASVELSGVSPSVSGTEEWSSSEFHEDEGDKKVTVTVKDKYGRSSSTKLEFKVDVTSPVWKESENGADVPTTISGGQKTTDNEKLAAASEIFWFNTSSITLSGKAWDKNEITGYTLKVNDAETTSSGGNGYSILANYDDGLNNVTLKAKDAAGNESSREISVYVDTVQPELETPIVTVDGNTGSSLYIKAESQVTVSVSASDKTSGVSKILIGMTPSFADKDAISAVDISSDNNNVNGNTVTEIIDISEKVKTWTDGKQTIYIRAVDKSGLSSIESYVTGLIVDKTPPSITYTSHSQNASVNKIITISGIYTETNPAGAPDAKLYYRTSGSGEWTESSSSVSASDGTWSVSFDTRNLSDKTKYDFQLRMKDVAGNTVSETADCLTLYVNQDSDRPVIKLGFATDGTARLNNGTFSGSITDDDGDVKELYFKAVPSGTNSSAIDWKSLAVTSGSWEIPSDGKLSDGTYTLYFKVKDAENTEFITGGSVPPYIQYSTSAAVTAAVSFSVDTTAPDIKLVDFAKGETESFNENYSGSNIGNNEIFGGVWYKYAKFKIDAEDSVSKGENLTVTVDIAGSTYTADYNSSDKCYYTEIDFSSITSGIYQLTVTASDEASMSKTFTRMVIIDNAAPETIKNVTPSKETDVTGDFDMTGLVQDDEDANSGLYSDGEAMWYCIPTYSQKVQVDSDKTKLENLSWKTENFARASISWTLKLGNLADIIGYNSGNETVSSDYTGFIDTQNTALYKIPVWFKMKDNAGNTGYNTENYILFNPNADKPQVLITYPGESEKEDGKILMGGTARFQGTANDNEGIEAVYLQFDMNGDGTWENGEGITGVKVNDDGKVYAGGDVNNVAVDIPVIGQKGFKAKGTLTWTSSIDLSGITLEEGKTFNVRAIAIDSDTEGGQLASAWKTVEITINNDIPQFGKLYLVQYEDSSYSTLKKMIDYSADVFISGDNWRLEGSASHKEGITSITAEGNNSVSSASVDETTMSFTLPVKPNSSGNWSTNLTATDKGLSPHPRIYPVSVNVDNDAPAFAGSTGSLVLYKDAYGIAANQLSTTVYIQNSNGNFASISSRAVESGSGFERAVFYFERNGSGGDRIYNVMKPCGADRTENRTDISAQKENGKVYINAEKLPVLYMSGAGRLSTTTITVQTNDNIRAGGLVKIGGAYHKISGVTSSEVTLADEVDTDFKDVEFVYGMVVDNSGESRNDSDIKNDDGDGMVESYSKSGSNYIWDAEIPSANIPDGPVMVHVVLFDKAGNSNHSYVKTRISNNPIRITTVQLGTDLNGNGTFEASEYEKFYAISSHSTASGVEKWSLDTKKEMGTANYWTVKNKLAVIPEFVGGTGEFKYVFTTSGTSPAEISSPVKINETSRQKGSLTPLSTDAVTGAVTMSPIEITDDVIGTAGEDKDITYQFTFWDSTEETTSGVDSSWTILNAAVHQNLTDNTAPLGYISPFYWNGKDDNSLFENSLSNGHIELEADWKSTDTYKESAVSGIEDSDPKVSGKIVLRGKIYDDVRLNSLYLSFADFGEILISSFTDGSWSAYTDASGGKIPSALVKTESIGQGGHLASFEIVVDTSKISGVAGTDKSVTIKVTDASSNTFEGSDTEGRTSTDVQNTYYASDSQVKEGKFFSSLENAKAGTDAFTVSNSDMKLVKGGEVEDGFCIYKAHSYTAYYRIDVVPYITGVKTYLGTKLKSSIVDAYSRSALGHYVVSADETAIELTGFNLGSNKTVNASSLTSGEYSVSVSEIESLNNKNNDNACGAYEKGITENSTYEEKAVYAYNRQPVEKSNHLLTDNIWFDVWEFDSDAAIPMSGKLSEPVMKINPTNGKIGFAFVSGPADFSMADGNGDSYKQYQRNYATFSNVSLAFDDAGNSYGTATGLDTYPNGGATEIQAGRFTFMTSRWGIGDLSMDDNYNAQNKIRFEAIGLPGNNMCYVKGTYPSTYTMTETRFASPSLAVASHESNTSVYLAYYDDVQGQIRFRYGSVCPDSKDNFNNFVDNSGFGDLNNGDKRVFESNTSNFSLIAGADWQKYKTSSDTTNGYTKQVGSNWFYDTGYNAGQYVAIDVIAGSSASNDKVVAVWYDGTDCWLGLNTNPTIGNDNGKEQGWSCKKIFSDGGEYCTVKTGPDGSIHIAANVDGSLKYAYIKNTSSINSYNEETDSVTVDSFTITGEQINIDVGRKLNAQGEYVVVPVISYYLNSAKLPAVASLVIPDNGTMDYTAQGTTVKDVFTGKWEVSPVPTPSTMSGGANDKVNVGLWKKTVGTVKGVIVKSSDMNSTTKGSNDSKTTSGNCYGNGTANPVLGYAIKTSSGTAIETAQLK
ncbi:hypothetical protein [Treponema sp.]|uniref:hypothetical protein n=1 Tax=Treponema sp. TaxID=166 RepID=UPI00257DB9E6|nr:hypothetical protein [Treponema sp.]